MQLLIVLMSLCIASSAEGQQKSSTESAFDLLALTVGASQKMSREEWESRFEGFGLKSSKGGANWELSDERGRLTAFVLTEGRQASVGVTLHYYTPLAMAPAILEALTKGAAKTRTGSNSTLDLSMPREKVRDRRCFKESQYSVSLQGEMVSKGFALICG